MRSGMRERRLNKGEYMNDINLKRCWQQVWEKAKEVKEGRILFYGSSTFTLWKTMEEDMLPYLVVNNGFGGSTAEEALYYYYLLVRPFKPSAIVYYEGDNDLAEGYEPEEILTRVAQFFKWAKTDFPGIPLYIVLVKHCPARDALREKRQRLNDLLTDFASKNAIEVIDLNKVVLDEKGNYNLDCFEGDGLHINRRGNLLFAQLLKNIFSRNIR